MLDWTHTINNHMVNDAHIGFNAVKLPSDLFPERRTGTSRQRGRNSERVLSELRDF